ncbi:response regulator [Rhodanobacter sp. T12-5]|uniref:response regulator n=1 Tax=Rhodanobacter sp. T12-5 TaxID=2024611 RepID=UPI0011EC41EA|nr:response regulator [Rhodanobacter sp. T12-5]KAA0072088.1 response regulator [Rhodanobacter sp. T12-5]
MTTDHAPLCILLAEDEMLLAMMLEDRLNISGYRVLKAARLAKCMELAESAPIDLAILDINLAGEASFPAALILRRRGIPFVFSSGYDEQDVPEAWRNENILQKPYDSRQLNAALTGLLAV